MDIERPRDTAESHTSAVRELLSQDHEAVNKVLQELLTALHNNDAATAYSRRDLLWARLAVHIRAEHLHLFPAVLNRVSTSTAAGGALDLSEVQSVVVKLRGDHDFFMLKLARAVGVLRELSQAIASSDAEVRLNSVLAVVLEVEKRLQNHNEIEENQIYRWAGTILTESEQFDLHTRINRELEHRPPRFSPEAWARIYD